MWKCFVDDVAASRELSPELLMKYAEELAMTLPEDALTAGLIDRIAYEDELNELYDSYGVERNSNKLHTKISLAKYASMLNPSTKSVSVGNNEAISLENNPLVAIIYADGEIVDGTRKAELLRLLCQFENIDIQQSVAVGDGANDLPMLNIAGLGIAFHAKPKVRETASQSLSTVGLDGILYFLGLKDSWVEAKRSSQL